MRTDACEREMHKLPIKLLTITLTWSSFLLGKGNMRLACGLMSRILLTSGSKRKSLSSELVKFMCITMAGELVGTNGLTTTLPGSQSSVHTRFRILNLFTYHLFLTSCQSSDSLTRLSLTTLYLLFWLMLTVCFSRLVACLQRSRWTGRSETK